MNQNFMYGNNNGYFPQAVGNPYMANMIQQQMYQQPQTQNQQLRPSVLYGRIVNNFNEIVASEIPMDGNFAVFPLNDGTAIAMKRWNNQGTIDNLVFVKSTDDPKTDAPNVEQLMLGIAERLDRIEGLVSPKKSTKKEPAGE